MSDKRTSRRVLTIILAVLVLLYIVYQIYTVSAMSVKSDVAVNYTAYDIIDTMAFAVRDEQIVYSEHSGTKTNAVEDGTRVTYTTEVMHIFDSEDSARKYEELCETQDEIAYYESVVLQQRAMNIDRSTNDNKLNEAYISIVGNLSSGNYSGVLNNVNKLKQCITNKQILTGEEINAEQKLDSLKNKRDTLNNSINKETVNATEVGYFCGKVDGYEDTLNYANIDNLTMQDINGAISANSKQIPDTAAGRINKGFVWYFACVVDTASIGGFSAGDYIDVRLPRFSGRVLQMTVDRITNADSDHCVLILSSQEVDSDILSLRIENVQIITRQYEGIRVRDDCLRTDDKGNLGVYVLVGNLVKFRTVDCIYASDDYAVVKAASKQGYSTLENYDNVIYEGKGLYDGKVI